MPQSANTAYDWSQFYSAGPQDQSPAPSTVPPAAAPAGYDWAGHYAGVSSPQDGDAPPGVPQDQSWTRYPKLLANAVGTGVNTALGLPGTVADLATAGVNALTGSNVKIQNPIPTSGTGLEGVTNALGVTNRPEAIPTTPLERYGTAGVEGAISALPAIASGGAAVPMLAAGVTGGEAAQGASDLFPGSKIAPIVAGLLGGLGTQGVASMLAGSNIEKVAAGLGSSTTSQQAGTAAQEAARDWKLNIMPQKMAAVSGPLDEAIPAEAPVSLDNFSGVLSSINKKAGDLQPLVDLLSDNLPKQLQTALSKRAGPLLPNVEALDGAEGVAALPAGPAPTTWANARALRTTIGDALSNPQVIKGISQQNLTKLYAGLSQDLGETATAAGASDLWNNFNNESTRLYNFASGPLSKLISTTNPALETIAPETAASRLLAAGKKGATDLTALRTEVPDAVDELAAAHLRSAKPWTSLSPEAKAALVPDPAAQRTLDLSVPLKSAPTTVQANALHALVGEGLGHAGSVLAGHLFGVAPNSLIPGAVGDIAGIAAPSLYHGAKNILANPALLRMPATGAIAGANQLTGSQ